MKLQVLGCPLIGRAPLIATVLSLWLLHHGLQSRAWSQNLGMGYSGPLPIAVPAGELTREFQLGEPERTRRPAETSWCELQHCPRCIRGGHRQPIFFFSGQFRSKAGAWLTTYHSKVGSGTQPINCFQFPDTSNRPCWPIMSKMATAPASYRVICCCCSA
jgi:hypothetical protein